MEAFKLQLLRAKLQSIIVESNFAEGSYCGLFIRALTYIDDFFQVRDRVLSVLAKDF